MNDRVAIAIHVLGGLPFRFGDDRLEDGHRGDGNAVSAVQLAANANVMSTSEQRVQARSDRHTYPSLMSWMRLATSSATRSLGEGLMSTVSGRISRFRCAIADSATVPFIYYDCERRQAEGRAAGLGLNVNTVSVCVTFRGQRCQMVQCYIIRDKFTQKN